MKKMLWGIVFLGILGGANLAMAQCSISGTITAEMTNDPGLPVWCYTMEFTWDTGSPYALSHADLLLDGAGGTCVCADFSDALEWYDPVGSSDGTDDCIVNYTGHLECNGDPSIPGVEGYLLKFEPIEVDGCEPANTGTAVVVFYSNLPPAPIDEDILSIVDKHGQEFCFGSLSGDFPALACDPVDVQGSTWGKIKGEYR
jgi:hypothetical protein